MTARSPEELRENASDLQDQVIQVIEDLEILRIQNPKGFLIASGTLRRELNILLKQSEKMHQKISDLLGQGTLEEVTDVLSLEKIVWLQKELLRLHSHNFKKIHTIVFSTARNN